MRFYKIAIILFFTVISAEHSFAAFFLDMQENPYSKGRQLPGTSFGALLGGSYYLSGVDAELQLLLNHRISALHSLGFYVDMNFPDMLYESGIAYRLHFNGEPFFENDDFLLFAVSVALFEQFDDYNWAPRLSIGYGRDYRPFETSDFAIRFEIGGSYLIGEMLARETTAMTAQGAHIALFVRMGVMI